MSDSILLACSVTLAGRPAADCLPAASTISGTIMSRFHLGSALPAEVPIAVVRREVTAMMSMCRDLAARLLAGDDPAAPLADLRVGVLEWANAGVAMDATHKTMHAGVQVMFDHLTAQAKPDQDHTAVGGLAQVFTDLSCRLATVVSQAYSAEMRAADGCAEDDMAVALMTGTATTATARACGVRLADSYVVFAIAFDQGRGSGEPRRDRPILAPRTVRRVRAEVRHHWGDHALMHMVTPTAIVLIPQDRFELAGAERLIVQLAAVAQTPARATVVTAEVDGIPEAVERAHALLEIMRRLRRVGLERFEDLSLEYQLSRPGAACRHLAAMLDPLDNHPVLLETLKAHLATHCTRLRTARALRIHPNTVDNRLRKIAEITGLDPMRSDGAWRLRAAFVARLIGADEAESTDLRDPDQTPTAQAC